MSRGARTCQQSRTSVTRQLDVSNTIVGRTYKPRREQRGSNTDEVVEDRHPNSQHECCPVHQDDKQHPSTPANNRMAMQMSRVPEDAYEEKLARGMRVQTSGYQEVRNGDAICRFLPHSVQRTERRARHGVADVYVGNGGEDGVEGRGETLQRVGGFHCILRPLHL